MSLNATTSKSNSNKSPTTFESFLDHILTTCGTEENMKVIMDRLLQNVSMRFQYVRIMFHTLSVIVSIQTVLLLIIVSMLWKLQHGK